MITVENLMQARAEDDPEMAAMAEEMSSCLEEGEVATEEMGLQETDRDEDETVELYDEPIEPDPVVEEEPVEIVPTEAVRDEEEGDQ